MVSASVQPLHLLLGVVVSSHHAQQLHESNKKKPVVAQGRIGMLGFPLCSSCIACCGAVWSMDFKASGGGSHVQEIHQEGHQGHRVVQEEVLQLGHNFLGMEQIFLGLISDRTGIAAKVLKSMVVNLKDAPIEGVLVPTLLALLFVAVAATRKVAWDGKILMPDVSSMGHAFSRISWLQKPPQSG
ncbi:unnamed protein product [Sphagnum tenellum]